MLRLAPATKISVDDYDVDALELELGDGAFSFRLALGRGLDILLVVPVRENDRLRVLHVDSAVRFVDEVAVWEDPWCVDLSLTFTGNDAPFHSVTFTSTKSPPSYDCEVLLRDGVTRLRQSWRG